MSFREEWGTVQINLRNYHKGEGWDKQHDNSEFDQTELF